MPDWENVISALECISNGAKQPCRDCEYSKREEWCIAECAKDALALLKAQEPVRPVVDVDTWTCGKCGHTLEHQQLLGDNVLFHEQYDYCPNCGKQVKWDA